jgi:hypothetical protein
MRETWNGYKLYTIEEIREKLGGMRECDLCDYFNDYECKKNKRPRKYLLENGPNAECYAHFSCTEFVFFKNKEEHETMASRAIDVFFAV